jgi:hypothetical protein
VCLRKLKHSLVIFSVVLNSSLTDLGDVKETMQKVGRPIEVLRSGGDCPAETAEAVEGFARAV